MNRTKKRIYLISGKMGSGKNFTAGILKNLLIANNKTVTMTMFAGKLKQMASEVFKPIGNYIKDEIDIVSKNCDLSCKSDPHVIDFKNKFILKKEQFFEEKSQFSRLLLQTLGTDIIRTYVDDAFWIKATGNYIMSQQSSDYIITDWRYENEHAELKKYLEQNSLTSEYEFVLINVKRQITRESSIKAKSHDSEHSLNHFKGFNMIIQNSGDDHYVIKQLERLI